MQYHIKEVKENQLMMVNCYGIIKLTKFKTNHIRKENEIALILKSLLETEFKEIRKDIVLKFGNKHNGRTWKSINGLTVIEINPDQWIKWPAKSYWIASYKEVLRHELLHILLNFTKDEDSKFQKEAKKRGILRACNFTDSLIELCEKAGFPLSPQEEKELVKIISEEEKANEKRKKRND